MRYSKLLSIILLHGCVPLSIHISSYQTRDKDTHSCFSFAHLQKFFPRPLSSYIYLSAKYNTPPYRPLLFTPLNSLLLHILLCFLIPLLVPYLSFHPFVSR
uniref:Uncharacterized protein n=1 Tax=Cacopsylla melanoneura TaxID=428564 RepID=A0A8D8YYI3_9HEMI